MVSRPTRPPLDRDTIAAAALALIDKEGLEALSMRRLGLRLGVEAMALYHHFPSKANLLDAVAERLIAEIGASAGEDWRAKLVHMARRYRALAVAHPHAFLLLTTRRAAGPRAYAAYETLLSVFRDAGFEGERLAQAFRLVGYFINGAGHAEIATRQAIALAELGRGPPPDPSQFPLMAAVAPHLVATRLDDIFEFGLAAILATLDAAPRRARPRSAPRAAPRPRRRGSRAN